MNAVELSRVMRTVIKPSWVMKRFFERVKRTITGEQYVQNSHASPLKNEWGARKWRQ